MGGVDEYGGRVGFGWVAALIEGGKMGFMGSSARILLHKSWHAVFVGLPPCVT